jgi:hypothetical protein
MAASCATALVHTPRTGEQGVGIHERSYTSDTIVAMDGRQSAALPRRLNQAVETDVRRAGDQAIPFLFTAFVHPMMPESRPRALCPPLSTARPAHEEGYRPLTLI